jgi:hypothetical protein
MWLLNPGAFAGDQRARRPTGKNRRTSRQERVMATTRRSASIERRAGSAPLSADFADLVRTLKSLLDPYRPELHYMRGPGPKWHAKHRPAQAAHDAVPAGLRHVKA